MPKAYIANPFRSGTVFQEGSKFGYYGKDIYGKFHQSPVLYSSREAAKDALDRQIFNKGVYRMNPTRRKRTKRAPRRTYRRNPARTVADPHAARELALCYDNERAQQAQKESIINNLARKMAKGTYDRAMAVKLWGYAAKSGADAYAKTFGSHGDTGATMFNAATRLEAAKILENENRDYVTERSESFRTKTKTAHRKNPSPAKKKKSKAHRRNPSKIKYYIVAVKYPTGTAFAAITQDTHGDDNIKFRLETLKSKATYTQSLTAARRWAKAVHRTVRYPTGVMEL